VTRLEDDAAAKASWFGRRSVTQLGCLGVAVICVLVIGGFVISYASSWFSTGAAIVSPTNVKAQWTQGYQDIESLRALAGNYCDLRQAENDETDQFQREQRESEVLAEQQAYNRVAADYDRAYENLFEGKLVKPSDLPSRAPSLDDLVAEIC
jgi:hypothetical protein